MATGKLDTQDGFKKTSQDAQVEDMIARHCAEFDIDFLNGDQEFCDFSRRHALKRFLAHVELFKLTLDVPGDIVELGVFRGLGLFTWANLLESYCIGDRTKVVYGFDNWTGFTALSDKDAQPSADVGKSVGGFNPANFRKELLSALAIFDADRFIPQKPRVKLIEGNIEDLVAEFVAANPGVRFSMVHFDCDLYAPTRAALRYLWDKVSRGGVLLFDEYGILDWPGETAAVDEFLAENHGVRLQTFNWTNVPGAYIVKA